MFLDCFWMLKKLFKNHFFEIFWVFSNMIIPMRPMELRKKFHRLTHSKPPFFWEFCMPSKSKPKWVRPCDDFLNFFWSPHMIVPKMAFCFSETNLSGLVDSSNPMPLPSAFCLGRNLTDAISTSTLPFESGYVKRRYSSYQRACLLDYCNITG